MKAPYFWNAGLDPRSREAAPLTRALLTPLAELYNWSVKRKIAKARSVEVDLPVICIGNLTVGGVGKTPIVEKVRAYFAGHGLRAASLSRGYGGNIKTPTRVTPDHSAAEVGDEPLMLSTSGESWIGRDRVETARLMKVDGVDIVIMDDGHQNPSLFKHLSIVVIDAAAPFGNGHVLPKGPLRETVPDGLARADAVILMGDGPVPAAVAQSGLKILRATIKPLETPPKGPLVAFAGIGRPIKFFDSLEAHGAELREAVGYGDHHAYSDSDLTFLRKLANEHQAQLITTTKDHVRLPLDFRTEVLTFAVEACFEDELAFTNLLKPLLTD